MPEGTRFRHGLVIGKFAPLHAGHQLLIDTAFGECDQVSVWCYSNPDFPDMPAPVRHAWLRELYPHARVLPEPENPPGNDVADDVHARFVRAELARLGVAPDVVFTSEAYGEGLAAHLGIPHRLVDPKRTRVPVSGTLVRRDVHAARAWLDARVYGHFIERVVLMGAESTGKSTLTRALADAFGTLGVQEYGRDVFEREGGVLRPEHFVEIARGHRALEDEAVRSGGVHRYLFVDTNAVTTLMWSFLLTRTALPDVLRLAGECRERYAHVFVCADDLAFEQDGWRSNTSVRAVQQAWVLHDLTVRGIPFVVLRGTVEERLQQVITHLDAAERGLMKAQT